MAKPILCLDFDGMLHSYSSRWQGQNIVPDPPTAGVKEFLEMALNRFDVQVFSSRSKDESGLHAMMEWCALHFGGDITMQLRFPITKPAALLTINDRAITFIGFK